jgi:prevent-host-death family protein
MIIVETIGAFDAKTRLSELLERTAKGESFQITKHGRPVGKIVPPDTARDPKAIAEAVRRLKSFRGTLKGMSRDEMLALRHEGHGV